MDLTAISWRICLSCPIIYVISLVKPRFSSRPRSCLLRYTSITVQSDTIAISFGGYLIKNLNSRQSLRVSIRNVSSRRSPHDIVKNPHFRRSQPQSPLTKLHSGSAVISPNLTGSAAKSLARFIALIGLPDSKPVRCPQSPRLASLGPPGRPSLVRVELSYLP